MINVMCNFASILTDFDVVSPWCFQHLMALPGMMQAFSEKNIVNHGSFYYGDLGVVSRDP